MKQHIFIPFALILLLSTSLTRAIDDKADIPPAGTIPVENEFEIDDPHSDIEEEQQHARWNVFNSLQLSKSTKVKLIKAGLYLSSAVWLAGQATSIWAIATQWENSNCEDHYYCTNKYSGMQEEVASSITNCTGPYVQSQPIVEPECQMGSGKAAAFSFTIVCGWIPALYATVRACRLK